MSRYKFKEDEIPYAILEEFGLTQEMIEDLPVEIFRDILNSRLSPVLPIRLNDKEGNTVSARAHFKLVRDAAENADIVFHPRLVRCELDRYAPVATAIDIKSAYDSKCGAPSAGSSKVFFKYFYVNTATGEKSGDVLAQAKLSNE